MKIYQIQNRIDGSWLSRPYLPALIENQNGKTKDEIIGEILLCIENEDVAGIRKIIEDNPHFNYSTNESQIRENNISFGDGRCSVFLEKEKTKVWRKALHTFRKQVRSFWQKENLQEEYDRVIALGYDGRQLSEHFLALCGKTHYSLIGDRLIEKHK